MIAFEFPPINGSGSGRPLQFAKYLPEFGFQPLIIAQKGFIRYGSEFDYAPLKELKDCVKVHILQPFVFDKKKSTNNAYELNNFHSSQKGFIKRILKAIWMRIYRKRELGILSVLTGLKLYFKPGYDIIWATGPPWSSMIYGYYISIITRKPFVVDIRDPMTYGILWRPRDRQDAKIKTKWEQRILKRAARIIFTSPLTTRIMKNRTKETIAERMLTITNGFSEQSNEPKRNISTEKCLFCYVGKIQKKIREPNILFEAMKLVCRDPLIRKDIYLRFIGNMDGYDKEIQEYDLQNNVDYIGYVSRDESLQYMQGADVLVLIQTIFGEGQDVIGGKVYEYIAAKKPVLGVVPDNGGDAWLLQTTGAGIITGIDDPHRIAEGIKYYWELWKENRLSESITSYDISHFNRRELTKELAGVFQEITNNKASKKSLIL